MALQLLGCFEDLKEAIIDFTLLETWEEFVANAIVDKKPVLVDVVR